MAYGPNVLTTEYCMPCGGTTTLVPPCMASIYGLMIETCKIITAD